MALKKLISVAALVAVFPHLVFGVYSPQSDEDWTQLKPEAEQLEGSFDSVPFPFGIVVNPYVINHEGDYVQPPHSSVQRTVTTTYVTSHETEVPKPTKAHDVVYQIPDGQIQRTAPWAASSLVTSTVSAVASVVADEDDLDADDDQQVLENRDDDDADAEDDDDDTCDEDEEDFVSPVFAVSCINDSTLKMTLQDGILRDANERIGCIVGSHQFQFDGPLPQYGSLYAAGWSITNHGQLALGNSTKFYQCSSGEFYNLYDEPIAYQCNPVVLDVVELIDC